MRLMSFRRPDGTATWGIAKDDGVIDMGAYAPSLRHALWASASLQEEAQRAPDFRLDDIRFLPPIPDPDKILCIGLNYTSHIREGGREPPPKPIIFTRFANSQVGHGQPMIRPKASENFDFEGELAVVIGRSCRHVTRQDVPQVIAGYACYNDGSIRDWQRHSSQFTPGKNFVGSGAFGPWIVTPDELGNLRDTTLKTRLNGEEMQSACVDDLCFDIPTLVIYCSTFTRLEPGDVIVTGTTGGVGAYRTPPVWMKPGDTVEVDISGIGILRNPIGQEE